MASFSSAMASGLRLPYCRNGSSGSLLSMISYKSSLANKILILPFTTAAMVAAGLQVLCLSFYIAELSDKRHAVIWPSNWGSLAAYVATTLVPLSTTTSTLTHSTGMGSCSGVLRHSDSCIGRYPCEVRARVCPRGCLLLRHRI